MDEFKQECQDRVNHVAMICEAIAYGNAYINRDGDIDTCEYEVSDWSEIEDFDHQADFWDYLADNYNERYILDGDGHIVGARFEVACGGPNIWVDAYEKEVQLYWGSSEATAGLSTDCCDKIIEFAIDYHRFRVTM